MNIRSFFAFLCSLCALSVPGFAQEQQPAEAAIEWHRIQVAEGAYSVEVPCRPDEIEVRSDERGTGFICRFGESGFSALLRRSETSGQNPRPARFEEALAQLEADEGQWQVDVADFAGLRAIRATSNFPEPIMHLQIVEPRRNELAILAVMEVTENALDGATLAVSERFFGSMEVPAQ